jgi:hypothetical protein
MAERVYAEYEPGEDLVSPEEKAEAERWERVQRAEDAWNDPEVRKIARSYDILDRFRGALKVAGVVGEDRPLKLLFVAGHSRFLDRPISVAVNGPSSAGKSYAVESAITNVQPNDTYIFFTGLS